MPETIGWGWPFDSRKAHWFGADGRSLCGKWAYFGLLEQGNDDSPDNCAECKKRLAKAKGDKDESSYTIDW